MGNLLYTWFGALIIIDHVITVNFYRYWIDKIKNRWFYNIIIYNIIYEVTRVKIVTHIFLVVTLYYIYDMFKTEHGEKIDSFVISPVKS